MAPPMIAGLYPYVRNGVTSPPRFTMAEIPVSLEVNPWYRDRLIVMAGDAASAAFLESQGLKVLRTFEDAPEVVRRDSAHKMKHWMCRWALKEFGEYLWVDWDTIAVREPDPFWESCRATGTPKFIRIPGYWATVNCGVYYCPATWSGELERSFEAEVSQPNDELLWRSVLPADVVLRPEFWWDDSVVHLWSLDHLDSVVGPGTCFVHTKDLAWHVEVRAAAGRG